MKKVKFVFVISLFSLVIGLFCFGVFSATNGIEYGIVGKMNYEVQNSIELKSTALSLSATASCTHVSATSGTGVTGLNIYNYFKVIYNGVEQNQTQMTTLISNGTLVVSTSNVTVSSGLVKMSNVSSSAKTSQSLSLSLKFSGSSDTVTKSGTGTITRTDAGTELKNVSAGNCKTLGYSGDYCCTNCGTVVTKGSSTTYGDHSYKVTKDAKAATEHIDGYTATQKCSICSNTIGGTTITRTHTDYEGYYWGSSPTCTRGGWTSGAYCSKGCYDYSEYIYPTGHSGYTTGAYDADCTNRGYTGDEKCSTCGATISTGTYTDALGHDWVTETTTYYIFTCLGCGNEWTSTWSRDYGCVKCGEDMCDVSEETSSTSTCSRCGASG